MVIFFKINKNQSITIISTLLFLKVSRVFDKSSVLSFQIFVILNLIYLLKSHKLLHKNQGLKSDIWTFAAMSNFSTSIF